MPAEYSEGAIRGESSNRRVRASASDCIESVSTPPIAERPWPNHGGGQRWSLTRSPLRQTVPPLMLRVPTIVMMKDTQPIHRWVLPQSSVGGRCVTCSRARVLPDFDRHSSFVDAGWAEFWHRTGCLRCFLLVMCTHPFAKKALTLHLAGSEGHERYFGCNLMHRKVLASSHQHLMAEAPTLHIICC